MTDDADAHEGDLRTTYVGGLGNVDIDEDDLVLGVIRYKYDFVERSVDRNVPALAPPKSLLDTFKEVEEIAEDDGVRDPTRAAWESVSVRKRYLGYLERRGPQTCLTEIRNRLDDGQNVWLVCLEKDDTFCHRRLLEARIRGSSPTHWSDLHEPPEPDGEDESATPTLGDFAGGETA